MDCCGHGHALTPQPWTSSGALSGVQPVHVATWVEAGTRELAAPSVKQRLATIRHLFDWLVTGQVAPVNPAGSVRGPRHVVTSGETPVLRIRHAAF